MQAFFQDGERIGLKIRYSFEDHPLGTAGPLSLIQNLDDTFLVVNGDVLTTLNLGDLVRTHRESQAIATIATHYRKVKVDLGVIQYNNANEITNYIEKPSYDFFVSMGIYIFEPRVLQYIPHNEYLDFPNLVLRLIENKERVMGYPFDGYWQDLGRPDDYAQAVLDFEEMRKQILVE
jgi:NDP-sugar pyrophosphorylase family protein